MKFFPGQGKVREFWFRSGKLDKNDKSQGKVGEFQNFLKTEMAMAASLIFRNINLQNWPHSFVKCWFYSLKISALLEDLVAEDSCKRSWEAVENVWKMVKSRGKSQVILK